MKRIDITTTQNVVIEYKAASTIERFLAWLIDICAIGISTLILWAFIALIVPQGLKNTAGYLLLTPISLLYHLLFEIFNNGASLGKLALSLRVVKLNNDPVSIYDYFMRWAFRLIDISASLGIVAVITISSSPRNQRIGDFLADTTVIKLVKSGRFSLNRVMELDSLKNYEPQYPEIVAFSEQDMLVLKDVIERCIFYPGEGATKALELAIERIENILGIKAKERNTKFLKTLIKDYVALTR